MSIGKEEDKMGMRLSCTSEVIFDNVRIPKDHMLGRKNRGFKIILETLDHSRAGVGAFGVGIGQRCVEEAAKYAKQRKQFGVSVSTFQSVQNMLADMEIQVQASRQALPPRRRVDGRGAALHHGGPPSPRPSAPTPA